MFWYHIGKGIPIEAGLVLLVLTALIAGVHAILYKLKK